MDFYKFCQILENSKIKNEWDPNEPDEGPEDHFEYPTAHGDYEMKIQLIFKDETFQDVESKKIWPVIQYPALNNIIGNANDTYTLETRILVTQDYKPGYDYGGGDSDSDEFVGEPHLEIDGFYITNDRTQKSVNIPEKFVKDRIIGLLGKNVVYKVEHYESNKAGKIEISVS